MTQDNTTDSQGFLERTTGSTGVLGVFKLVLRVILALLIVQVILFIATIILAFVTSAIFNQGSEISSILPLVRHIG